MSFFSALRRLAFDRERSLHCDRDDGRCGRDDGRCKGYEEGIQGNDPRFQWLGTKSGGGYSGSLAFFASVRFTSISSNNIDGLITVIGIWPSRLLTSASLPTATRSLRSAARIQLVEFGAADEFFVAVFLIHAEEKPRAVIPRSFHSIAVRLVFLPADLDQLFLDVVRRERLLGRHDQIADAWAWAPAPARRVRVHWTRENRESARGPPDNSRACRFQSPKLSRRARPRRRRHSCRSVSCQSKTVSVGSSITEMVGQHPALVARRKAHPRCATNRRASACLPSTFSPIIP